jgi:hypothetical protein
MGDARATDGVCSGKGSPETTSISIDSQMGVNFEPLCGFL